MPEATLHDLNELVRPEEIRRLFPKLSPPLRVTIQETVDYYGEEAYDVVVVYPDSVPELPLRKLIPLVEWIKEKLLEQSGGKRWPYFWFRHESDTKPKPTTKRLRG